jgi:very-short-patch-repair endonuclease
MTIQETQKNYKKKPNRDTFRDFQILFDPNHQKCRECGDVIYYEGVEIRIKNRIVYRGASSYQSTKKNGKETHQLEVCQDCLFQQWPEISNSSRIFNTDHEAALWAFGIKEVANKSKRAITLSNLVKKYGELEGKIRYDQYREKQAYTNTFEYKQKMYGWTKEQFDEFNRSRAITVENLVKKYGEDEGVFRFKEYCDKQAYTNTLEYFVKKYGKEEGKSKFYTYKKKLHQNYSDVSQWLFNSICENINVKCLYATQGREQYFTLEGIKGYFDFFIPEHKIVIEYDGDSIHANPKFYEDYECCHPFNRSLTAKQIREKDRLRDEILQKNGYKIIRVWHSDYIKNPKETINTIVHKIKNLLKQKENES